MKNYTLNYWWILFILLIIQIKKILNYFKSKLKDISLVVIDVGTHKGETIDFFLDNFNVKQIYCCEPNSEIFSSLSKKENIKKIK